MLNLPGALPRDKQFWRVWGVKLLSRSLWVSSVATILSITDPEQWSLATEIWFISYGAPSATSLQVTKANFFVLIWQSGECQLSCYSPPFCLDRDYFFINSSGHFMLGLEQVGWPRPMACDPGWQVNGLATSDVLRRWTRLCSKTPCCWARHCPRALPQLHITSEMWNCFPGRLQVLCVSSPVHMHFTPS